MQQLDEEVRRGWHKGAWKQLLQHKGLSCILFNILQNHPDSELEN